MAIRIPRGYAVDRPYYQEISKGERLATSEVPLEAFTGLAHERVDEIHHDPVVLEPGTLVGISTGALTAGSSLSGALVPVRATSGVRADGFVLRQFGSSEASTTWGLPGGTSGQIAVGIVKPIGVIYQPIYSFILQDKFTNYTRNVNVGVLTNYVIQIPVTNDEEAAIYPGDIVSAGSGECHGLGWDAADIWALNKKAGRYKKYESTDQNALERVVGRCLGRTTLGTTTESVGVLLRTSVGNSTFTISTAAEAAYKGLGKVQTVPGLGLAGSGTGGIPGWLLGARSDGGQFTALTILIRL